MADQNDFETYIYIEKNNFKIFLLNIKSYKNLYYNELISENNIDINFQQLSKFIDDNIFKIEKLQGKFIEDIFIIIDNDLELQTTISIKKNNNNISEQKILNQTLVDLKDLFKENNKDQDIIHMLMENLNIDGEKYNDPTKNFKSNYLNLDVRLITFPNKFIYKFNELFGRYQIRVKQFLSAKYLNGFILDENFEIPSIAHKIINGYNANEIQIVPKVIKNKGFFEKFFQLFS